MADNSILTQLEPEMPVLVGGDRLVRISKELADKFQQGDRLIVVRRTAEILHIPKAIHELVTNAVDGALEAFEAQQKLPDEQITQFYTEFANRLADDEIWAEIGRVNEADVNRAKEKGRSTTRLVADEKMRKNMIAGLHQWRDLPSRRDKPLNSITHDGWSVEEIVSPCGVVGFVFEGRPNVLADATGVLRSGNTAVFRIGSDALNTAKAIMENALRPALEVAGLPRDSVILLESPEHSAGWALFADPRLALAVARGSGRAVDLLGAIAREAGNAVSLHGTGGGWIIADETADASRFELAVYNSLDRKVCNTVNVICIPRSRAAVLVPRMLSALSKRGEKLGYGYRIHVATGSEDIIPKDLFETETTVYRADGLHRETLATSWPADQLEHEWEWEQTPEVTVVAISDLEEGVRLFNSQSPLLVASLISEDPSAHEYFLKAINAPFIGNGFTRWVDGQYALNKPELGLSNWQYGRILARGAILTGDGVFTIKLRARQVEPDVHR
ncbi:MAG: aldehyde dehydrogenase family protein [Armatimonadota bacterium]